MNELLVYNLQAKMGAGKSRAIRKALLELLTLGRTLLFILPTILLTVEFKSILGEAGFHYLDG